MKEPKLNTDSDKKENSGIAHREHREFHNCYTVKSITNDIRFLNMIYDGKTELTDASVTPELINNLKYLGKRIYFFILSMDKNFNPNAYIKRKYEFINNYFSGGNPHLFFLAWNGLIKNDSFKRLMMQVFNLRRFNSELCPQNIPHFGSNMTRYRTKLVLADDMATDEQGVRRKAGRSLDDGSGLSMQEGIIWLPNGKAIPLFPQAYVPINQTQVILVRHGRSHNESGGSNPVFVGSGYWDSWENNRRIPGSVGNYLHEDGINTARELGKDFKVAVDCLEKENYSLWSWGKDRPVHIFGSESENTEQTARYFLQEGGYTNISFNPMYGLNSQKYGALTHKYKKDIFAKTIEIYKDEWGGTDEELKSKVKKYFKNRFFHFPEGETLLESDWRIAFSFVELLKKNLGNRIVLADHSGAIRVFAAVIKTLDFADYASLKEGHESIIALKFQPGKNLRYDYLQKKEFMLR
ncbi:MAG: histidine phosphatase family protein [Candidatus Zophobacter franzmannii]|nr:histidine phosphatase family protein [Candidatus Zophobacter franzmannii]